MPLSQSYNGELPTLLFSNLRRLNNATHCWSDAVGFAKLMPGVVGFWPGYTLGSSGTITSSLTDMSGNGLALTRNGNPLLTVSDTAVLAYVAYDGTGDYYEIADNAILSITGTESHIDSKSRGLTVMTWVYFGDDSPPSVEGIITKWDSPSNRSYSLKHLTTGEVRFSVSSNGTAETSASSVSTASADTWYFAAGRFEPSTELTVWLDSEKTSNTTAIPASIFDSTSPFQIGTEDTTLDIEGRICLSIVCQAMLPDHFVELFFEMTSPIFGKQI